MGGRTIVRCEGKWYYFRGDRDGSTILTMPSGTMEIEISSPKPKTRGEKDTCRFGDRCTRKATCRFAHPSDTKSVEVKSEDFEDESETASTVGEGGSGGGSTMMREVEAYLRQKIGDPSTPPDDLAKLAAMVKIACS